MKTPEEYLPRSEPTLRKFKDSTEDIIYVPRYVAINSLKSMREDHEREMDKVLHSAIRTIKELLTMAEVPDKDRSYYYQHLQDYLTNFQQQDR